MSMLCALLTQFSFFFGHLYRNFQLRWYQERKIRTEGAETSLEERTARV